MRHPSRRRRRREIGSCSFSHRDHGYVAFRRCSENVTKPFPARSQAVANNQPATAPSVTAVRVASAVKPMLARCSDLLLPFSSVCCDGPRNLDGPLIRICLVADSRALRPTCPTSAVVPVLRPFDVHKCRQRFCEAALLAFAWDRQRCSRDTVDPEVQSGEPAI